MSHVLAKICCGKGDCWLCSAVAQYILQGLQLDHSTALSSLLGWVCGPRGSSQCQTVEKSCLDK